jgi:adenylate cyclase
MAETRRRLGAILAADVAGFSRLMGADEEGTIAALTDCRALFRETIESHHGRVVDTAGDSVLAVFDSVVEALRSAVEVQDKLAERSAGLAHDRRMLYRIGVNLARIIHGAA